MRSPCDSGLSVGNDGDRIFTFGWVSHNNLKGFSYGQNVAGTDGNSPTSYMWEYSTEDHAIPYTEVYMRLVNPNLATLAYTENAAPAAVLPTIVLNDVDNSTLQSATIQLSGNFASGQDILGFTNTANITGSYNSSTGVLTLTGSDTVAAYQAALRTVTYSNSSDGPSTLTRTVSFTVNDGSADSTAITRDVSVTAVNDAPVLDNAGAMTLTTITKDQTNNAGNTVSSIISSAGGDRITDVDSGAVEGIAITTLSSGNGTWQYSINGGTDWFDVGVVSNTSALLLRSTDLVRFVPNGENATTGDITFRAWDQTSGAFGSKVDTSVNGGATAFSTATESASIIVTDVNDAPIANPDSALAVEASGTNNGTAGLNPSGNVLANDTDVDTGDTKEVIGVSAGVQVSAAGSVGASVTGNYGSITINADGSFTYTVNNDNPTVQALASAADTLDDVFTYTMQDSGGLTSTTQVTITIQGANDAPVITSNGGGATANIGINENSTLVTTVVASDVDAGAVLTYSIVGGIDQAFFSINGATGLLEFVAAPDFENPLDDGNDNTYEVIVQVSDGSLIDTQVIIVSVIDVPNTCTVTTTLDNNDAGIVAGNAAHNIEWLNANKGADGHVSLREAIIAANNTLGLDTISFDIAGAGVHTISLISTLPSITDAVIIDAYSQSGSSVNTLDVGNDAVLRIVLDGAAAGASVSGLTLAAGSDGSTIQGLVINDFAANGIRLFSSNNTIAGNFIGTNATGAVAEANNVGILISNAGANTIGGTSAAARNVISGNTTDGVQISGASSTGNLIQGNYVGTTADGTAGLGNSQHGIYTVTNAHNNTIGGSVAGAGNIISGNISNGIQLNSNSNIVAGNTIGLNAAGNEKIANAYGVFIINGANNTIGGLTSAERNTISGNAYDGIYLTGTPSTGNLIQGNFIGTNTSGTAGLGNTEHGVRLAGGTANNTIGGAVSGAGNVISGNIGIGVLVWSGSNTIAGNIIGLDVSGNSAIANYNGITITNVANTTIGGLTASERNIISGNTTTGIYIGGASSTNTVIQGNYIGTDITGMAAVGNGTHGIQIAGSSNGNTIGGAVAGAGNVISGNLSNGILIQTSNNTIQGNLIGTNAAGTAALGNGSSGSNTGGIQITGGTGTIVGGSTAAARNVISGNGGAGIWIINDSSSHVIQGNYIGVDITGDVALGNTRSGIHVQSGAVTNLQIGGSGIGEGNVIAGNGNGTAGGIFLNAGVNTVIEGNRIGVGATTTTALATTQLYGISIRVGASNTVIGGATTASGNLIARNGTSGGVTIQTGSTGNTIRRNSIWGNEGIGIDLGDNGITANDGTTTVGGANLLTDKPVIGIANLVGDDLSLSGYVGSAAGQAAFANNSVDFYLSDRSSAAGSGQIYLGTLMTDANGNFIGTFDNAGLGLTLTDVLTATATDTSGNTSEFSVNFGVNAARTANPDSVIAVEAGGTSNGTAGTNPTGNVLTNDTDVDDGDTKTVIGVSAGVQPLGASPVSSPVTGTFGSITIAADGSYTYTLDNDNLTVQALNVGQSLQDTFTYTMQDSGGLTSTAQITVTIEGANDEQTIATNTGTTVDEGSTGNVITSSMLQTTDVDNSNSQLVYTVTAIPANGTLRLSGSVRNLGDTFTQADIDAGLVTYDHDDSQTTADSFAFTVDDGTGTTSSGTFHFTITNVNDAPVISIEGGDSTSSAINETNAALTGSGTLSVTDVDISDEVTASVIAVTASGTTNGLAPDNAALLAMLSVNNVVIDGTTQTGDVTWSFNSASEAFNYLAAGESLVVTYTIEVEDLAGATDTQAITITITGTNDAPTVSIETGDSAAEALTETNTTLTTGGSVTVTDLDIRDTVTSTVTGVTVTGNTTGMASSTADLQAMLTTTPNVIDDSSTTGTLNWDFNSGSEAFNHLAAGETLELVYEVTVEDAEVIANAGGFTQVPLIYVGKNTGEVANVASFAVLREDGTVVTWGSSTLGGDSSAVASQLTGVEQIYSSRGAFAALKSDGTVVTWGNSSYGADSSAVTAQLTGVEQIFSSEWAFAALKSDGTVVTWGDATRGGNSAAVASQLTGVERIFSTQTAFAALKSDGTVVTWGDANGGNSASVAAQLTGVEQIFSNDSAFSALKSDGTVVTWGSSTNGGNSTSIAAQLTNVEHVYATRSAFAALKSDGTVVTWGSSTNGGNSSTVAAQLTGVQQIYASFFAFAAVKSDGTVVTWGSSFSGGDSSAVAAQLTGIEQVFSSGNAFAALKDDGTVVT